jgi:uncharacterized protein (DUF302 family)
MKNEKYGITKKVDLSFAGAVKKTKQKLAEVGFGVLTEIDIKEKILEKLGKRMENYLILGACHPESAFEAIKSEMEIGLLLPCNVLVYEKNNEVFVSVINPEVALMLTENSSLEDLSRSIKKRLEEALSLI